MESNSQSYLMELKRQLWKRLRLSQVLSIVPYGIETKHICFNFIVKASSQSYLMELKHGGRYYFRIDSNALNRTLWNWNYIWRLCFSGIRVLSIVPYGIETLVETLSEEEFYTLNRTLWNWNLATIEVCFWRKRTLNRTLWNWNC